MKCKYGPSQLGKADRQGKAHQTDTTFTKKNTFLEQDPMEPGTARTVCHRTKSQKVMEDM